MTALEYFRLLASEYATVNDTTVGTWLTVAGNIIRTDYLDAERANMALALYAAHMLAMSQMTATGGAFASGNVTSEKEGDLQRTYGAMVASDTWLGQSAYGQQYLALTQAGGVGIMVRGAI
jgi:hypothetical protein